jgi:hypothetical protein
MEGRFHVDVAQADRVEATALAFLRQVRDDWSLDEPMAESVLAGRRGCTRSASTFRIRTITGTALPAASTRTCRAFRITSSNCSRRWSESPAQAAARADRGADAAMARERACP